MRTNLSILAALLLFLPACATTRYDAAQERLTNLSQELSATIDRLDTIETDHPAAKPVAEAAREIVENAKELIAVTSEELAKEEETRGKVGAGIKIGGDILGGPLGEVLGMLGVLVAGGWGARVVTARAKDKERKEKESSHNHGAESTMASAVDAAVKIVNGNKPPGDTPA
jgi:hypothetical protein